MAQQMAFKKMFLDKFSKIMKYQTVVSHNFLKIIVSVNLGPLTVEGPFVRMGMRCSKLTYYDQGQKRGLIR